MSDKSVSADKTPTFRTIADSETTNSSAIRFPLPTSPLPTSPLTEEELNGSTALTNAVTINWSESSESSIRKSVPVATGEPTSVTLSVPESETPDATVIRQSNLTETFQATSKPTSVTEDVKIIADGVLDEQGLPTVQLGDYTLVECIGGGGMGRVYRALDSHLDRFVALKVLAQKQKSEEFKERFIVEARAAAKLHHENIVTVYAFGECYGLMYLAMEYIPGINIRDLVTQQGRLSVEDTLSYAIQLSSALEHINQHGIVHRDIKPSNVLVTSDGTVKVIDLGLAKNNMEPADDLTATGVTLGTFDYISPEQARDPRNVDIRADIYSLGCSLFFMLTGQPPYPKGTGLQKLLRHQGDDAPNIQELRPDVPDRLSSIIARCMAKNVDMRYQSPQDLTKALFVVAEEMGMRPMGISLAKWYLPTMSKLRMWRDRVAWALPIVALVILVLILDSIWKPDELQMEYLPDVPGLRDVQLTDNTNVSRSDMSNPVETTVSLPPVEEKSEPREEIPQTTEILSDDSDMEIIPSLSNTIRIPIQEQ